LFNIGIHTQEKLDQSKAMPEISSHDDESRKQNIKNKKTM